MKVMQERPGQTESKVKTTRLVEYRQTYNCILNPMLEMGGKKVNFFAHKGSISTSIQAGLVDDDNVRICVRRQVTLDGKASSIIQVRLKHGCSVKGSVTIMSPLGKATMPMAEYASRYHTVTIGHDLARIKRDFSVVFEFNLTLLRSVDE